MEGGQLQIAIPRTWNVTNKDITVTDARLPDDPESVAVDPDNTLQDLDGVIYVTDTDGEVVEKNDTLNAANSRDKGRVQISMSGDKVVRVRVDLTGWGYTDVVDRGRRSSNVDNHIRKCEDCPLPDGLTTISRPVPKHQAAVLRG